MEEIAGFEERLEGLKQRGESLVSACVGSGERQRGESLVGACVGSAGSAERQQTRLRGQVQSHLQGARDSYSAICSTAQRVSANLMPTSCPPHANLIPVSARQHYQHSVTHRFWFCMTYILIYFV